MLARISLAALLVGAVGCGEKADPIDTHVCDGLPAFTANLTYTHDIKPIFVAYCTTCHSTTSGNRHGAPTNNNLDSYNDLSDFTDLIYTNVISSVMPPPEEIDNGVVNAPSKLDRCKVKTWIDEGALQ